MRMSLRGATGDEAISVLKQRLLRCARNDSLTVRQSITFCLVMLMIREPSPQLWS